MQEEKNAEIAPKDDDRELGKGAGEGIARRSTSIHPSSHTTDIEVDISRAERIPLGELASLGTGFASLPEAVRTVTTTTQTAGGQLLTVTDKLGNPLDVNVLQAFNDGSGIMGSYRDAVRGFGQARFHLAGPQAATVTTTVPYDPTSLFMAAALMEVNRKLGDIQQTQQEMFDYLKDKDRAKLRGDLDTLRDVLDNYRFNWNNETYKRNNHVLVQSIRKDAAAAIVQQRAEVRKAVGKDVGPVHIDENARQKARETLADLKEYRLSVYLYGFSSFLEVLLLENFDEGYLRNVAEGIESRAVEYRALYTRAYDRIAEDADSSIRAGLLGGVSGAMSLLGKAIEATPVGDLTQIDEALIGAGKGVGDFSSGFKRNILKDLPAAAGASDVRPFVEDIENLERLYNDTVMLLADDETIYVLPADAAEAADSNVASDLTGKVPNSSTGIEVVASDVQQVTGSAAWCATMQICWDNLLDRLCGGEPLSPKSDENVTVSALNGGRFDSGMVSDDHYYAYAGPKGPAAKREIESAIRKRFEQESDLLGSVDWSEPPAGVEELIFYCMLYRKFSFVVPFGVLEDEDDEGVYVTYFEADDPNPRLAEKMREQVRPLYYLDRDHHAVSINTREGDRVVLVRSPEGSTFAEMWDAVQRRAKSADQRQTRPLDDVDTFLCPNLSFDLDKRFGELEGVEFDAADGTPCSIQQALQTIRMTLDNEGGEVKSEAVLCACAGSAPMEWPEARRFAYGGPFALFLMDGKVPRGSRPYLAVMVDDIEKFQ
ncbi:MAG: hypothetical protein ACOX12_01585 [Eggerthellaceae bacterium]|jgi:hypothetical protein